MSYYQDDGTVAAKAIAIAAQQTGKPYIWGAAGPDAFDCSGLVHYAYSLAGLPGAGRATSHLWTTATIRFMGDPISYGSEQPGDLIMPHAGHVGIAIGGGQMWNAPTPGVAVRIDKYSTPFAIRRVSSPSNNSVLGGATQASLGGDLGAIGNVIGSFVDAAEWLATPHNWARIGMVVGGATCLYLATKVD